MSNAPVFDIDTAAFHKDPYPFLERMRATCPIAYVPALDAVLITKRDDVFTLEKKIDVFSSYQPDGLMTKLMGQNMMRKDGEAHQIERKAIFPTLSPKTVQTVWEAQFKAATQDVLNTLTPLKTADLVKDFAMPVSGEALKAMTGLTQMTWQEMDRVSQGMIDGCANYTGDPEVEARCHDCTASIDDHITDCISTGIKDSDMSLIAVQCRAGLSDAQLRANVKLAISGGQNEPRDAIAGILWALLERPEAQHALQSGTLGYLQVFEEFTRWISPIGMSPRRIAKPYRYNGIDFQPEDRVFLMFASANRDETYFEDPNLFNPWRDTSKSVPFGAGPHFCAGAWASRSLIVNVALPMIMEAFPKMALSGPVDFSGWAFRGPVKVPVVW